MSKKRLISFRREWCDRWLNERMQEGITMFALSQSQSEVIKQLRDENTKLRDAAKALCDEIEVLRDVIMHPDPDIEPDNIRLHREKCDALNRALEAEAERDKLRGELERAHLRRDVEVTDVTVKLFDAVKEINRLRSCLDDGSPS